MSEKIVGDFPAFFLSELRSMFRIYVDMVSTVS